MDSMVENLNLTTPSIVKDGLINNQLKYSKDVANWEHMIKSMVFIDRPRNSNDNEEEGNEADQYDDEGCEDSINELSTQVPPQIPINNRSRNMGSGKYYITPGRLECFSPSMTNDEAIKILAINRDCSIWRVKVNPVMLAIKYHPDKWDKRCFFAKEDGME